MLIFISINGYSQSYIDSYDGIPLIVYTWATNGNWLLNYNYSQIKEMGGDAVISPDLISTKFDSLRNANIKIIPYQTDTSKVPVNHIAKYTDAMYTVWEAEGTDPADGDLSLSRNTNNTVVVSEGIRTIDNLSTAGYIIDGPGYIQTMDYKVESDDTLNYTAEFKLKVEAGEVFIPLNGNNDNVCRIEVTYYNPIIDSIIIIDSINIKASEFISYGNWKTFNITYNKYFDTGASYTYGYSRPEGNTIKALGGVEFKIYFYGLTYLKLYCDNIVVSDERGKDLFTNINIQNDIKDQAKNTISNSFTSDAAAFDTMVVAWFPVDEHDFLDQWACVKKVNELVKENNNGRFLMQNIAANWNGKLADNLNIYRIDEFIKRAQPDVLILNHYLYDYPYNDTIPNYAELNIKNATDYFLDKMNNYDIPFIFNIQTGRWLSGGLEVIPTSEQLIYSANIGLLYGAKGLALGNYFYNIEKSDSVTALVSFTNTLNPTFQNQTLWYTVKDSLSPKLKGLFGKTLKRLTPFHQIPNNALAENPTINYSFINSMELVEGMLLSAANMWIDLGFFTDPSASDKYFLFSVSRYYSYLEDFKYFIKNPNSLYKNYKLTNITKGTFENLNLTSDAEYYSTLQQGDGELIELAPAVKYGGSVLVNEVLDNNITLLDNLTLLDTVFINENKLYNINAALSLQTNGFITGNGYITTDSNLTITTNSWSRALLKGKQGNNPRLHWAPHPTLSGILSYKIYRKKQTPGFVHIGTVSGSTHSYLDTTVTIPTSYQQNETIAEYYITCTYEGSKVGTESSASNTIKYHRVNGTGLDKHLTENSSKIIYSYRLEQNYPNPFNPATRIIYEVASQNSSNVLVQMKIYDILGNEITTLINEEKPEGTYSVSFNAGNLPSGVYIYSIRMNDFVQNQKMTLLK